MSSHHRYEKPYIRERGPNIDRQNSGVVQIPIMRGRE
ncbi:hypothetical protein L195_g063170, partial [Trifolium pratense]